MSDEIKIGVLLPQSKQYNTLDRDFIRGIRLNNLNAKLHIENIGIGADAQIIIEKIQKLSLQEDINLFVGFFGHHNIQQPFRSHSGFFCKQYKFHGSLHYTIAAQGK
jgi:hypothetical protein